MNKKLLILVAALAIVLIGCNKAKEEANVPVISEQQEQLIVVPDEQNVSAEIQQQDPAVEVLVIPETQFAIAEAPVAPVAPVAPEAPVAPIAPSVLVMSDEASNPAPVVAP